MFRQLLSNLPFNPSLVQEVSFYAKRLHKEEGLRRTGMVLVALSLCVQMFAAIRPAEASTLASGNDILYGGFDTKSEAVTKCRANTQGFATILSHYQLNCDSLSGASFRTIKSTDYGGELDSMGRWSYGPVIQRTGKATDEYRVPISGTTYYMRNLWAWDSGAYSTYDVLSMTNAQGVEVMVMYDCGNIITRGPYSPPAKPAPKPAMADIELATCDATRRTNRFYGWALDGDRPTSSLTVTLYIDGVKIGNYQTNQTRSELNAFLRTTGTHGFDINLSRHASSNDGKTHKAKVTFPDLDSTGKPTGKIISSTEKSFGPCSVPVEPPPPPKDACPGDEFPGIQNSLEECKPCEDSTDAGDAEACLVFDKAARNDTQNIADANGTTAAAGNKITYTLSVKNEGKVKIEDYIIEENMGDVMEYTEKIVSLDGGTLDENNIIHWPATDFAPGATVTKVVVIQVKDVIPQTPQSTSNPGSFDLMMTNTFHGKTINIKLPGSVAKIVEQTTTTLPNTGPGTTVAVAGAVMVITSYFFYRSRLMAKELDIVREDFASSGGV